MPETPNPNTPTSFFEALYTHFILRDFIGKIVPGGIFLYLIWSAGWPGEGLDELGNISGAGIVALMGLSWVMAIPLQQFSTFVARVVFRCEHHDSKLTVRFRRISTAIERSQYERFVIIKEASGNGGAALFLGMVFWVFLEVFSVIRMNSVTSTSPESLFALVLLLLLLSFSLMKSQAQHMIRQAEYVDNVLSYVDSSSLSSPTSEPTTEL
jgi:hypothetical protein